MHADHYGVEVKGALRSLEHRRKPSSVSSRAVVTICW
jgi:hypothetical protein